MKEVLHESDSAPPELLERAQCLVRAYPECFWYRHEEYQMESYGDIRLVIKLLREHGGHKAWKGAQELQRCLLQNFKKVS